MYTQEGEIKHLFKDGINHIFCILNKMLDENDLKRLAI